MSDTCIAFANVSKSYGGKTVIHDVSLALPAGITVAMVGESGSGKSTLLQLANGLVRPEAGTVSILGQPLDYLNLPELRRAMGYAVQGGGLFPHLTARENITLVAQLSGWDADAIETRLGRVCELLALDPALTERFPHTLSGGQQQRVSLCRAMMLNPELLLLDEPFSALDPITRRSIHDEFLRLQAAEARSVVIVTHDMAEAVKLAQYLVILRDGRVAQEGAVDDVRGAPADAYVAGLFEDAAA